MHEFAIAQALVEQANEAARRAGAQRVTRLTCRVGTMRQVDPRLLEEAFALASTETMCAGASLVIQTIAPQASCTQCDRTFSIRDWRWTCPDCGTEGVLVGGGDELELISLDAEVPDEDRSPAERVSAQ